jgi:hypothetical protein
MKKNLNAIISKVQTKSDGTITGGYAQIKGGFTISLTKSNSDCTNTDGCTNSGDCTKSTNKIEICTNSGTCLWGG